MEHKYLTLRIWEETHRALRLIAALTGRSMIEVLHDLATKELDRIQQEANAR